MSEGCTSCGRKGGCDHRKAAMFAAIDEALTQLYPGRCWDGRAEGPAGWGIDPARAATLGQTLARRLSALCVHLPGSAEEYCAYLYVLCTGRPPALVELREGMVARADFDLLPGRGGGDPGWEELYLRVALSSLAPFAAVQQVTMRGARLGDRFWVEEGVRAGVFDPQLLPRFQKLVAVLAELGIRNLDCGDISEPPAGFDPGGYPGRYGEQPGIINYLFYPQPAAIVMSTMVPIPDTRGAGIE